MWKISWPFSHLWMVACSGFLYQMPRDYCYSWVGRQDSGCCFEREDNRRNGQSTPEWLSARKVVCEQAVWVDVSLLVTGVVLQVDGSVIEDMCWLHPECNTQHIDLAELDVVLWGIKLALQWKALFTDSACVYRWLSDSLTGKAQLTTKAANEMLIQWQLDTFVALIHEYNLSIDVLLVWSDGNRADSLTRVSAVVA